MAYSVKEIFYTLQGEGINVGRAAVFLRFSGCNLWSGVDADRATASCNFCDTDFVGLSPEGGKFPTPSTLADAIEATWASNCETSHIGILQKLVVCTGGEPLLQLDESLIEALAARHFEIAVETNGTIPAPKGIDWLCVSPKGKSVLKQRTADELKLVFPQTDALPEQFLDFTAKHFLLQPMDGANAKENLQAAIDFCLKHPQWRLSLQTHKLTGVR